MEDQIKNTNLDDSNSMQAQDQIKALQEQIQEMQGKIDALETEKEAQEEQKYKGNSWVQLALNDERKKKIDREKGINSFNSQKVITIIAAIILILSLIIPRILN